MHNQYKIDQNKYNNAANIKSTAAFVLAIIFIINPNGLSLTGIDMLCIGIAMVTSSYSCYNNHF